MEFLQIVHNLSRALAVDASLARLEERSRHVLINDESVCGSCHARLGTKLFAMYPDDTIVCYKVCDDYLTIFFFPLYILFSVRLHWRNPFCPICTISSVFTPNSITCVPSKICLFS